MQLQTVINRIPAVQKFVKFVKIYRQQREEPKYKPVFIEFIPEYNLNELIRKNIPKFQRDLEPSRLRKILTKMFKYGFIKSQSTCRIV